ncbi:hypothetical protein COCMIDRAFT_25495 [Bipolaris oryzae ATCC 44560]|uniref:Uncharacterized protein n=1 Tax=Bipolaris oryzae ATCC 44560 TaxID=930090 RepID=W6Z9T0_COCMI|nr:uncharacterized protein COCMIDRAFT_25495 [Bipolaris oryzae ATCC 44560]EUC46543.1 hypothetical protein COCMIDRAFT_25495 [Bipolaris oryzae ATCC 44560]
MVFDCAGNQCEHARLSNPAFTLDTISEKAKQLGRHEKDIGQNIAVTKCVETKIQEEIRQLNTASDLKSNNAERAQQKSFSDLVDDESNDATKELTTEQQLLKSSDQTYYQLSKEALRKTMSQCTGTNVSIRGVTVTEQGLTINGVIPETGKELKI